MEFQEQVIGYDARELPLTSSTKWDVKRRNDFLFRPDVPMPLSVDTVVWPSILDTNLEAVPRLGFQDSWSDLVAVQTALRPTAEVGIRSSYLIAITLLSTNEPELEHGFRSAGYPVSPADLDETWNLLGYDVADEWLLSALTNCGFLPDCEDVQNLRDVWAPKLNNYHLFSEPDHSWEFVLFSNQWVSEHAPFFAYGVWLKAMRA